MTDLIRDVLSFLLTVVLAFVPYLVFAAILFFNFLLMRSLRTSHIEDPRPIFAYTGGFLVFIIGFAILQSTNVDIIDIEPNGFVLFVCSTLGVIIGYYFIGIAHRLSGDNYKNWYIFLTNASVALAATCYIFIRELRDVFVFLTLGIALGVIVQLVQTGYLPRTTSDKAPKKGGPLP